MTSPDLEIQTNFTTLYHQTPLIKSIALSNSLHKQIYLKLENTQPSGSFKSRGLGHLVQHYHNQDVEAIKDLEATTKPHHRPLHFFSSSGGNAGLATAVAATSKGHKCTVVVPSSTKKLMRDQIEATGAQVVGFGNYWVEADEYLRKVLLPAACGCGEEDSASTGGETASTGEEKIGETAIYCHPYDNQLLWTGIQSIVTELSTQLNQLHLDRVPDAIVCSVGGGGLYTGIVQGLIKNKDNWTFRASEQGTAAAAASENGTAAASENDNSSTGRSIIKRPVVITVETEGASKLAQSLAKGYKVTLKNPNTVAVSLAASSVSDQAYAYASAAAHHQPAPTGQEELKPQQQQQQNNNNYIPKTYSITVTDQESISACTNFAKSNRIIVEPACGAALAGLAKLVPGAKASSGEVMPDSVTRDGALVVVIVCGGSSFTLEDLVQQKNQNGQ